jgi:hypothetical protein
MRINRIILAVAVSLAPGLLRAQWDFNLDGKDVQVHSFASQGFMYTNQNNYMSMPTTSGSFAFTDFGANISSQLTDKFRVGAQIYDRNVGSLGNWYPSLDWAVADYKFNSWFGIRAGKVKTTLGLYNDTQDMEFLSTWALMPQSLYSLDQRGSTIAHEGGDVYGSVEGKKAGSFNWVVYGGFRPNDPHGGYVYALDTSSKTIYDPNGVYIVAPSTARTITDYSGPTYGADFRWTTPLKGLLVGTSYLNQTPTTTGYYFAGDVPYYIKTLHDNTNAFYTEYTRGNFKFDGEYRREPVKITTTTPTGAVAPATTRDGRSGYVAASYRISKLIEVGSYESRFIQNWGVQHGDPRNHIFDLALTVKFDLRNWLDLKVEEHFMDGYMTSALESRGFYVADNQNGLKPGTDLFVIRLGYHL